MYLFSFFYLLYCFFTILVSISFVKSRPNYTIYTDHLFIKNKNLKIFFNEIESIESQCQWYTKDFLGPHLYLFYIKFRLLTQEERTLVLSSFPSREHPNPSEENICRHSLDFFDDLVAAYNKYSGKPDLTGLNQSSF